MQVPKTQYKVFADIRGGSLERRRQETAGVSDMTIFSAFGGYVFGTIGVKAVYIAIWSPSWAFH